VVDAHLESGADIDEDGIDDAFELLNEVSEHVRTGGHRPLSKKATVPSLRLPKRFNVANFAIRLASPSTMMCPSAMAPAVPCF